MLPGPIEDGPYPTVVEYSGYDPSNPIAGSGGVLGPAASTPRRCAASFPILCKAPAEPASLLARSWGTPSSGSTSAAPGARVAPTTSSRSCRCSTATTSSRPSPPRTGCSATASAWSGLSYPGHLPAVRGAVAAAEPGGHHPAVGLRRHGHRGAAPRRHPQHRLRGLVGRPGARQRRALRHGVGAAGHRRRRPHLRAQPARSGSRTSTSSRRRSTTPSTPTRSPGRSTSAGSPTRSTCRCSWPSAWQDEQTGPSFADLLDRFDRAPVTRFTLYNGLHADGFAPQVLSEWKAFLDLYVADAVPCIPPVVRALTPVLTQEIFGGPVAMPPDRWGGRDRRRRRARPVRSGAAGARHLRERRRRRAPGCPSASFEHRAPSWPDPGVVARRWWLARRRIAAVVRRAGGDRARSRIHPDPDAGPSTYWYGSSSDIWKALPDYQWEPAGPGEHAAFETAPLHVDHHDARHGQRRPLGAVDGVRRRPRGRAVRGPARRPGGARPVRTPAGQLPRPRALAPPSSTPSSSAGSGTSRRCPPAVGRRRASSSRPSVTCSGPGPASASTVNTPGGDQATWAYELLDLPASVEHRHRHRRRGPVVGRPAGGPRHRGRCARPALSLAARPAVPDRAPDRERGRPVPRRPRLRTIVAPASARASTERRPRPLSDRELRRCTRLNQVQVIGSHNSYKQPTTPEIYAVLSALDPRAGLVAGVRPPTHRRAARAPGRAPARARRVRRSGRRRLRPTRRPRRRRAAERPAARAPAAGLQGPPHPGPRLQLVLPHLRGLPRAGRRLVRRPPDPPARGDPRRAQGRAHP